MTPRAHGMKARPGSNLRAAGRHGAMLLAIVAAACAAPTGGAQQPPIAPPALRAPDVAYEPTATEVVHAMLRLAKVTADDVVYDLGCGDGRIVITAVRDFGARGVGVDIDPLRIAESRENARQAGVTDRIRFLTEDLFLTDLGDATVVTLFLSQEVNLAVRPEAAARAQARHPRRLALAPHGRLEAARDRARSKRRSRSPHLSLDHSGPLNTIFSGGLSSRFARWVP